MPVTVRSPGTHPYDDDDDNGPVWHLSLLSEKVCVMVFLHDGSAAEPPSSSLDRVTAPWGERTFIMLLARNFPLKMRGLEWL